MSKLRELLNNATQRPWAMPEGECDTFGQCPLQLANDYEGWRDDCELIVTLVNAAEEINFVVESYQNVLRCEKKCDLMGEGDAWQDVMRGLKRLEKKLGGGDGKSARGA